MNYRVISEKTLNEYLQEADTLLIDLRSRSDYETRHIPSAIWLDWERAVNEFPMLLKTYENEHQQLPAHIVLYCDSGHISLITARDLAVRGYTIMSLNGGFHRWHGASVS